MQNRTKTYSSFGHKLQLETICSAVMPTGVKMMLKTKKKLTAYASALADMSTWKYSSVLLIASRMFMFFKQNSRYFLFQLNETRFFG